MGLNDGRSAVDAIAESVLIEERLLGARNKEASLKTTTEAERHMRIATIQAMKKELERAKKMAKFSERKTQKENFGGAKGFLSANSKKTITDNKTDRKEFLDMIMDRILSLIFDADEKRDEKSGFNAFTGLLEKVEAKKGYANAKDSESRIRCAMVSGYLNFLLGEYEDKDSKTSRTAFYEKSARQWFKAFDERRNYILKNYPFEKTEENDLADVLEKDLDEDASFFAPLGKICALESAGHAFVRAGQATLARPYLIAYCEAAENIGELPAYHNLPDSYLLQRGMQKMDAKSRRAFKWKHRAHLKRAIFDAYSSVAAASRDMDDRDNALQSGLMALSVAKDLDAKTVGHNNLAFLYGAPWKDYEAQPSDKDNCLTHSCLFKAFEAEQERQKEVEKLRKQDNTTKAKFDGGDIDEDLPGAPGMPEESVEVPEEDLEEENDEQQETPATTTMDTSSST